MDLGVAMSALLIFSAACYFLLGARLVTLRREVGAVPIGALFFVVSFWVLGGAIELLADNYVVFSIGRIGHFIGTALAPVIAYVCFREYAGRETATRHLVLLTVVPLISITLAATNVHHELMWYLPATNTSGEFLTRPNQWGIWFLYAHLPYSYALIGAGMATLAIHLPAVAPAHRRGLFLLLAACVAPLGSTVAYDLGYLSRTVSFVPFVFAAMLPVYAWLIYGVRIIEFTPLAYETVFQNMQDPVVVIDDNRCVIGLNHTAEAMLSIDETQALRKPLQTLLGDDSPEVLEALDSGRPQKMMTATGRFLHVQVSPMKNHRGTASSGRVLMFRDVSDVERAQTEVRENESLLRTLIDHSVNGIIRYRWKVAEDGGKDLNSIFANSAAARFLGCDVDTMGSRSARSIVALACNGMNAQQADVIWQQFSQAVDDRKSLNVEVRHESNGVGRWLRMICEPVGDDIAATFVDITSEKAKQQQMESIAVSDALTGVLNRRGFENEAAERLSGSADDATGALLFIDLNDFKLINDDFGHEVGDALLRTAADRLQKSLRSCDIIGRPGGDEFVALVPDVSADVAEQLATRLAQALEAFYVVDRHRLRCAASIGLALYPSNANTLTGLLREADKAMYRAKARCRGVSSLQGLNLLEKAM